jgi:hypothetical protein
MRRATVLEQSDQEITNLSRGGTGRGDLAARMLAQNLRDVEAEPLLPVEQD